MDIGSHIKYLRNKAHFSQEEMADQLGISQAAYGDIEKKKGDIHFDRLCKIAGILNVSFNDLLPEDAKEFALDPQTEQKKPMETKISALEIEVRELKDMLLRLQNKLIDRLDPLH